MNTKPIYDHLGNKFDSEKEMCKCWNINYNTYANRKSRGYTIEECLFGKIDKVYDHEGNKFKTEKEMYEHRNVNDNTYKNRKSKG